MKSKFSGAVLFVQLRWLLGLYLLEFRSYLNLKKETVLEKLTFGVTTGLIATSIWTFFTTDKNYSSLSAFLNSEVTFSVWVLILISIVCVLLIYINFVNKKRFELDYQLKVRSIATPIQNDGEISEWGVRMTPILIIPLIKSDINVALLVPLFSSFSEVTNQSRNKQDTHTKFCSFRS